MSAAPKNESDPQGDVAEAVRFLQALRPEGAVCLCAIVPDGATETATFDTSDTPSLRRWIGQRQGHANLYYTVNAVRGRPTKKPSKDDIERSEFLWLDIDPSPTEEARPGGLERERVRLEGITSMLDMLSPTPPTFIVDTGNGFQVLWRRSDPEELDGKDGAATARAEQLGRLLELCFSTDKVRNVDRLLRLPGTLNLPNATKRAKGRGTSVARLLAANDTSAGADDLRALCLWRAEPSMDEPLRGRLAALLREDDDVLRRWLGCTEGLKDGSRSALAMSMAGLLSRRGFERDDIAAVLSAWDKIEGTDLSERQIERMVERTRAPALDGLFRLTDHGVEKRLERVDKDTGAVNVEWRWVCSRLEVVAETRNADGEEWGRLLRVADRDGRSKDWAMPMSSLAGDGTAYRERLLSLGLVMAPGKFARDALHEYISTAQPKNKARCVGRIGWHGRAFVLPDATLGDTSGEAVLLQAAGTLDHAFRVRGTLDGWRQNVARYAVGNSRLALALSAAFAAPLLHLTGAESGGFHLRGASSTGKSTALVVAGSVWGGGGVKGYVRQWRATDNGLEAVAVGHCDTLLCLDELAQIAPSAAGAAAYMIANGAGKARAGRTGEGRAAAEWRSLFLSSGEIGIADKLAEDGKGRRAAAGQQVRVVDIPADAGAGLGLFEELHGFSSADGLARHLKAASADHFGTAARAFLDRLAAAPEDAAEKVSSFRAKFAAEYCPQGADGQIGRVAARFALVAAAGELATAFGVLPWQPGDARIAAAKCFADWLDGRGGIESAEERDAIAAVRRFVEMHGSSRFEPMGRLIPRDGQGLPMDVRIPNRAGFKADDGSGGVEYLVLPEVWRTEVCSGMDAGSVAKILARRGVLAVGSDGKPQKPRRLPGFSKPVRVYTITPAILSDGDEDSWDGIDPEWWS
ncbi:MAG TPA: DUF927 domain-containing protein [Azospirillaceae bacterium]|nr:DUF927 domain-containing protein [Azospirillaceae bacterium]